MRFRNPDEDLSILHRKSYSDPVAAQRFYAELYRRGITPGDWFAPIFFQKFSKIKLDVLHNFRNSKRKQLLRRLRRGWLACDRLDPDSSLWTDPVNLTLPGFPGFEEEPGLVPVNIRASYECLCADSPEVRGFNLPGTDRLGDHLITIVNFRAPIVFEYPINFEGRVDEHPIAENFWVSAGDDEERHPERLREIGWTDQAFVERLSRLINALVRGSQQKEIGERGYGLPLFAKNLLRNFIKEKQGFLDNPPSMIPSDEEARLRDVDYDDRARDDPFPILLLRYHRKIWRESIYQTVCIPGDSFGIQAYYRTRPLGPDLFYDQNRNLRDPVELYFDKVVTRPVNSPLHITLSENWTDEEFIRAFIYIAKQGISLIKG